MIRELLTEAKLDPDLCRGECRVVRVQCNTAHEPQYIALNRFLREWEQELDHVERTECGNYIETRWLAVVHDDGAVLVPLDAAALSIPPF